MARKPRIHYPGAFYHVILRGNNKQSIFFSDQDREYFYSLLQECILRYKCLIHAFCLMTNHVHLMLQVSDIPLSKVMQYLCFRYTQTINKFQGKVGHLFQGRYKAILIDADSYLLELVRYIHLNPVHAKMVDKVENYYWSSHRAYKKLDNISWLTRNFVLNYFSNKEEIAIKNYLHFVNDRACENFNPISEKQQKYDVLGDDDFLKNLNIVKLQVKYNVSFDNLISMVFSYYSLPQINLSDKARSSHLTKLRAVIGWLAKEFNICSLTHVAKFFNRDLSGLIRSIGKLESVDLAKNELYELKNAISKSICQA